MTSLIQTVRQDLENRLTQAVPDVPILRAVPAAFYPPALIVSEGEPFISPPDGDGPEWSFAFEVLAVVAPSSENLRMVAALDDLVSQIVEDLATSGVYTPTVAPYTTQSLANEQPLLGARISIQSHGWIIRKD